VPRKKVPRPQAAKARLAAVEASVSVVKLQAIDKLDAAHEAAQRAVEATKESLKSQLPWNEREQDELGKILRGGAHSDSDLPLGEVFCGPSPDEARDRVQQCLGWHKAIVGTMKSRSGSSRDAKAETDDAKFNRKVEEALAETSLPPGKGRGAAAMAHLKSKFFHVWTARERGIVGQRIKRTWFKDRMTASQKLRAKNLGGVRGRAPIVNEQ
jgi:hypothetical protein